MTDLPRLAKEIKALESIINDTIDELQNVIDSKGYSVTIKREIVNGQIVLSSELDLLFLSSTNAENPLSLQSSDDTKDSGNL